PVRNRLTLSFSLSYRDFLAAEHPGTRSLALRREEVPSEARPGKVGGGHHRSVSARAETPAGPRPPADHPPRWAPMRRDGVCQLLSRCSIRIDAVARLECHNPVSHYPYREARLDAEGRSLPHRYHEYDSNNLCLLRLGSG